MRIDAVGGAATVRAIGSEDSKIRAPGVAERMAETTRGIAFGESLSTSLVPKTR